MNSVRHPNETRRRVLGLSLAGVSALGGFVFGAALVLIAPLFASDAPRAPALPTPSTAESHTQSGKLERFAGKLSTQLDGLRLRDREGYVVLEVQEMSAGADLAGLNEDQMVVSGGSVRGVELLLRRGKSGRLSLVDALNDDSGSDDREHAQAENGGHGANAAQKELAWRMGPLRVRDVKMTVAMMKRPLVVHVDSAVVRVEQKVGASGPRVFLSDVHGTLLKPDPLPQPLTIRGAEGVVDLSGGTFVDVRTRVCAAGDELRVRIAMPKRHQQVHMTVDADGLVGKSASLALHLVAKVKDEKLDVDDGPVEVEGKASCSRTEPRKASKQADAARIVRVRAGR